MSDTLAPVNVVAAYSAAIRRTQGLAPTPLSGAINLLRSTPPERGQKRHLGVRLGVRRVSAVRSCEKAHLFQEIPCGLDSVLIHVVQPVDV